MTTEKKMTRCFMNGKSCIYERVIDECLETRGTTTDKKAFVIMPFGDQLDVLYQWEIAPFLRSGGKEPGASKFRCIPERADDIRQVGFIICEKICKRIQESDYVVVDVSFDNPNVFYEFGLAAALRKEIVPICVGDKSSSRLEQLKTHLGLSNLLPYPRFDMLEARLQDYVWQMDTLYQGLEQMAGDHIAILYDGRNKLYSKGRYGNEEYGFGALCKTAVGTAISTIFSPENLERKQELKLYDEDRMKAIKKTKWVDLSDKSYRDVIDCCKNAACALIDVSGENSITNFFWLGYIHGIGGNAIPVNSYRQDSCRQETLIPFDIRALWHVVFREDHAIELSNSLSEILEYIYIRKAKYLNREAFWKDLLKDNKVSIFLGSLYLEDLGRNTIGDWDYRTAAEITNYLSTSKETMKVTLESPLPKRVETPDAQYVKWLEIQLRDNSIIVASADVNDLTEVALCKILGKTPFTKISDEDKQFKGYIAHKKYAKEAEKTFPETAFYVREKATNDSRGFIIREGTMVKKQLMEAHAYPGDHKVNGIRKLLGQLVVAKNPFADGKWIVIISGISGPATLGIAQMLTGCMYKEFTVNNLQPRSEDEKTVIEEAVLKYRTLVGEGNLKPNSDIGRVPYDALSEHMLSKLLKVTEHTAGEVNALVAVDVYYPLRGETTYSNDERKVIAWDFPDLTEFVGTIWANPSNLKCSHRETP